MEEGRAKSVTKILMTTSKEMRLRGEGGASQYPLLGEHCMYTCVRPCGDSSQQQQPSIGEYEGSEHNHLCMEEQSNTAHVNL